MKKTNLKYFIVGILGLLLIASAFIYIRFLASTTRFEVAEKFLYIPTEVIDKKAYLLNELDTAGMISNKNAFVWLSEKMHLWPIIKPGRYKIKKGTSIYGLVKLLKTAEQTPIKLILKKVRTKEQLAAFLGAVFEKDSTQFIRAFTDTALLKRYHLNVDNFFTVIIINTYNFFWNTTPLQFIQRCVVESTKFWHMGRVKMAQNLGLTPQEAYILASIVDEESNKDDEKPKIASVYLNRLHKGMKLEADPTVKFCTKKFYLRRILFKYVQMDCPYNTYLHIGLPPGPICTPSIASIQAVLQPANTDFLFFCARPERDGYHNFAATLAEHMKNARSFHKQLNKEKVF